eukprot:750928-Hanusia_phi.AAC.3
MPSDHDGDGGPAGPEKPEPLSGGTKPYDSSPKFTAAPRPQTKYDDDFQCEARPLLSIGAARSLD